MMSQISKECENYGKHLGTGHYHMCTRCAAGSEIGCADFKIKGQKCDEWLTKCPVASVIYKFGRLIRS
jgi:hypothetical protein